MESAITQIHHWMTQHPQWAGFVIFLVAFGESLALVGIFIPGATLLFAAGAMVGAGILDFWSMFVWASLGAILGDNLSYRLGYYYRHQLPHCWPFNRYPGLLSQGEQFFQKHGGKSVALGRFVGPIRAMIPVIAGMANMKPWAFFSINVISALAWAPMYLLPGVIVGASLSLAAEVAGRLAVWLIGVLCVLWLSYWIVKRLYRFVEPRAERWLARLIVYNARHRFVRAITAAIVDPDKPETKGLFSWGLFLATAFMSAVFLLFLNQSPSVLDTNTYQWLQGLRTPVSDEIMIALSAMGDFPTLLPATTVVGLYLLAGKHWEAAAHWFAAVGFMVLMAWVTEAISQTVMEGAIYTRLHKDIALPITFFGFLGILINRRLKERWRYISYGAAVMICVAIIGAKLYLGLAYFWSAVTSVVFALAWICILGIAYRRHHRTIGGWPGLTAMALTSFGFFLVVHHAASLDQVSAAVTIKEKKLHWDRQLWLTGGWKHLPAIRENMLGPNHPFNIQWEGSAENIEAHLLKQGWHKAQKAGYRNALLFVNPNFNFSKLPVLPHVYRGKYERFIFTKKAKDDDHLWVIRLWDSFVRIQHREQTRPLWLGNITKLALERPLHILVRPKTEKEFDAAQRFLQDQLHSLKWQNRQHPSAPGNMHWNKNVLLVRESG